MARNWRISKHALPCTLQYSSRRVAKLNAILCLVHAPMNRTAESQDDSIHHQLVAGILQQYKPGVFSPFQDLKSSRSASVVILYCLILLKPSSRIYSAFGHISYRVPLPLSVLLPSHPSSRNGFLFRYFDAFNRESDWIQSPEPRPDGEADGRHSA